VDAPRPQVYSVLSNFARYAEWLPNCEQSAVVANTEKSVDTEIVINTMKRMKIGLRFEPQINQALNFRLISSKDIKAYSGSYRLMDSADGGGTVVLAELELDAGPMAPKFLVDRMAKKALEDTGNALRKYMKSMPPSAVAPAPAAPKGVALKRARLILQVVSTPTGPRVWFLGRTLGATR